MDSDELDKWLDGDREEAQQEHTPWQPDPAPHHDRADLARRPSWKWLGLAGAAVWAAVMAVVFLGGDGEANPVATPTAAPDDGLIPAVQEDVTSETLPSENLPSETLPSENLPLPTELTTASADPATSDSSGDLSTTNGSVAPPGIEAGAVSALRTRLTVPGAALSYLEWATPVEFTQLDAGIWLVVLEAIWLEGSDGDLSVINQGRWAVPVADDGHALSPPWPHPMPAITDLMATPAPPSGEVRVSEAAQALVAAGWVDVEINGSDLHAVLEGVVVVMVEGVPPQAEQPSSYIVWLREDPDGVLTLLGADQ